MPAITLNVNGVNHTITVSKEMPLLWAIRDVIGLTGTKYGCGIEICGACSVLIDGKREKSCDVKATEVVGRKITTVEGLSADNSHPAQKAWIEHQVPQCGYCQPGMLIAAASAMKSGKHGAAIASSCKNLCVCGTYQRIKQAVVGL